VNRSRAVSLTLLGLGAALIVGGVVGMWGVFVGLIVSGVLLIAAEMLVPSR
jgi:hypothetical protein